MSGGTPGAADLRLAQGLAELAKAQLSLESETLRRQDSEALFDQVFSAMADAVLLVDPRGRVSRANPAAGRLTGRPRGEIVGLRPADVFGPGVPTTPWELFGLAPGGTMESIDASVHAAADQALPVDLSCAAIHDSNGKVIGAVYAARDTSRRRQAEQQREAQLELTRILATSRTVAEVLRQMLETIGERFGWQFAAAWLLDPQGSELTCQEVWRSPAVGVEGPMPGGDATTVGAGHGNVGRAWASGQVEWADDVRDPESPWAWIASASGLGVGLYVPVVSGGDVLGVIELLGAAATPANEAVIELLAGMGRQIGGFIERRRAQEALDRMDLFQSAFENAPLGMALFGVDGGSSGRLLQVNDALCDFLGAAAQDIVEAGLGAFTHPNDRDAHLATMEALFTGELLTSALETRYVRRGGEVVMGVLHCSLLRDGAGWPIYGVGQIHDVTERKRAERKLAHQALHDPLTGLPNRILFMDRLEQALRETRRRGTRAAVVFADVDNFKVVNDNLGHAAGDELLIAVARRLVQILRPTDTVSRFGGDEFTILCRDVRPGDDLGALAQRMAGRMSAPFEVQGHRVFLTLSLGVAASDVGGAAEELLRDADAAMYAAKGAGRAGHAIFDKSMRRRVIGRLELEQSLRRAIEQRQLRLVYQPQFDLKSGRVFGFEALLRWDQASGGSVAPLDFIPLAEETGLIIPIGEWTLVQACRQAMLWRHAQHGDPPKVSVNVSVRQLADPTFPGTVRRVLGETGVRAEHLWLEVTETALIADDRGPIYDALAKLDRMGIRLAIDDFGVGFSSLNRFRQLPPVAAVKIDRLFVQGIRDHPADRAIVAAAIGLAGALGAVTIAEGVETAGQLDALKRLGCDLAQGYLFSRPRKPEDLAPLVGPRGATPGSGARHPRVCHKGRAATGSS